MAHELENAALRFRQHEIFIEVAVELVKGMSKAELQTELARFGAADLDEYYAKVKETQNG